MAGYIPSAKREDWRTPPEILGLVRAVFGGRIELDPCAPVDRDNFIAHVNFSGPDGNGTDGLSERWRNKTFVNPPFSTLGKWIEKCAVSWDAGAEVLLLCPARTDTKAWHSFVSRASAICFWKGRIRFVGAIDSCPFPVAFVYWGRCAAMFEHVFQPHGMVVQP